MAMTFEGIRSLAGLSSGGDNASPSGGATESYSVLKAMRVLPNKMDDVSDAVDHAKMSAQRDAHAMLTELKKINKSLVSVNRGYDPNRSVLTRGIAAFGNRLMRKMTGGGSVPSSIGAGDGVSNSIDKASAKQTQAAAGAASSMAHAVFVHEMSNIPHLVMAGTKKVQKKNRSALERAAAQVASEINDWALSQVYEAGGAVSGGQRRFSRAAAIRLHATDVPLSRGTANATTLRLPAPTANATTLRLPAPQGQQRLLAPPVGYRSSATAVGAAQSTDSGFLGSLLGGMGGAALARLLLNPVLLAGGALVGGAAYYAATNAKRREDNEADAKELFKLPEEERNKILMKRLRKAGVGSIGSATSEPSQSWLSRLFGSKDDKKAVDPTDGGINLSEKSGELIGDKVGDAVVNKMREWEKELKSSPENTVGGIARNRAGDAMGFARGGITIPGKDPNYPNAPDVIQKSALTTSVKDALNFMYQLYKDNGKLPVGISPSAAFSGPWNNSSHPNSVFDYNMMSGATVGSGSGPIARSGGGGGGAPLGGYTYPNGGSAPGGGGGATARAGGAAPKGMPGSGVSAEDNKAAVEGIPDNALRFIRGLGVGESGFRPAEANTDANNQPHNNSNVRRAVNNGMSLEDAKAKYGDYGFYQTNQHDVDEAIRLGVDPKVAAALNNGGGTGDYSVEQQTRAMHEYMKRLNPKGYQAMVDGDFAAANDAFKGKWPSLPGGLSHHPSLDGERQRALNGEVLPGMTSPESKPDLRGRALTSIGRGEDRVTESQGEVASIRTQPISDSLKDVLNYAGAQADVHAEVTSGGQPGIGEGGPRTGSTRHDHGNAADLKLYRMVDGKREYLDFTNPEHRPYFEKFAEHAAAAGATGIGAGVGYMGSQTMHVGFGKEATWGGADWVAGAHARGRSNQVDLEEVRREAAAQAAEKHRQTAVYGTANRVKEWKGRYADWRADLGASPASASAVSDGTPGVGTSSPAEPATPEVGAPANQPAVPDSSSSGNNGSGAAAAPAVKEAPQDVDMRYVGPRNDPEYIAAIASSTLV